MTQTIDAIYTQGVLKPLQELPLREQEQVRLTIETAETAFQPEPGALDRLIERLNSSTLSLGGKMPSREELHERDHHV